MIHTSQIIHEVKDGERFSLEFVDKNGDFIPIDECLFTSVNQTNNTMTVKIFPSGEFRRIRLISITSYNGQEVTR